MLVIRFRIFLDYYKKAFSIFNIYHITLTTRQNVSLLCHLSTLVQLEQSFAFLFFCFYQLSPVPILNDVHKRLAILANRTVQGDKPREQVGIGAEYRNVDLEHSCRKERLWGWTHTGVALTPDHSLAQSRVILPPRAPAASSLWNRGFGLPEVVSSCNHLWWLYITSGIKDFFRSKLSS